MDFRQIDIVHLPLVHVCIDHELRPRGAEGYLMSVQKHSLHTYDLACLCSVLHLKNLYFVISLIFSFISNIVGKLVQLEAY